MIRTRFVAYGSTLRELYIHAEMIANAFARSSVCCVCKQEDASSEAPGSSHVANTPSPKDALSNPAASAAAPVVLEAQANALAKAPVVQEKANNSRKRLRKVSERRSGAK